MTSKKNISACLKARAFLVLTCALVFLPPSVTHAASGMHSGKQVASVHADHGVAKHAHGAASSNAKYDENGPDPTTETEDHEAGQCCSGICVSGLLSEAGNEFVEHATRDKYLMLHGQTGSIEPSGFLRPPQHLI